MIGRRIPCKYHWKCVLDPVLRAFLGNFQSSDVHKTLRGLKNPVHAAAENVVFVGGLEPPCYQVLLRSKAEETLVMGTRNTAGDSGSLMAFQL